MKNIIMYSTGCPKCNVLKGKMKKAGLTYREISDIDTIMNEGISTVPVLEVDGIKMNFSDAVKWVNSVEECKDEYTD